jgi:hypothetical protein
MIEAIRFSEMPVLAIATQRNIPEDGILHTRIILNQMYDSLFKSEMLFSLVRIMLIHVCCKQTL